MPKARPNVPHNPSQRKMTRGGFLRPVPPADPPPLYTRDERYEGYKWRRKVRDTAGVTWCGVIVANALDLRQRQGRTPPVRQSTLADDAKVSRRTIQRGIAELVAAGLVEIEHRKSKGRKQASFYILRTPSASQTHGPCASQTQPPCASQTQPDKEEEGAGLLAKLEWPE